jgi:hypothetical protein
MNSKAQELYLLDGTEGNVGTLPLEKESKTTRARERGNIQ